MLTSKQRAQLRALASTADTIIFVGKNGITDNVIADVKAALKARELIKGKVQDNVLLSSREVCMELAEKCQAESVQSIGSKFVLYKPNKDLPKEKRINLIK